MPPPSLVRLWAQQILEQLATLPDDGAGRIGEYVLNEHWLVEIDVTRRPAGEEPPKSPAENRPETAQANAGNDGRLTPLMRQILSVLSADLQSRNRMANLCDHDNDSHFGKCLRRLVALGYAVRVGFSYRLPISSLG